MLGNRHKKMAFWAKGKILDIGCTHSFNSYLRGDTVVGFDLEAQNVIPRNYSRFIRGDAHNLSKYFAETSFDSILAGEVIEHLENPYLFLNECSKCLVHGGRLILTTPNPYFYKTLIGNVFFCKGQSSDPRHLYYQLPRMLNRLLAVKGFIFKHIGCGNGFPLPFLCYRLIYVYEKTQDG